jgi:eukaryotic-like serine/threonine-protein kinase
MSDNDRLVAGRYRLMTRLGSGGMGVVWQAHDEHLDRTVAVKKLLLPAELTGPQTEEVKRKAMREGRIAAKLQHPHSIMVYDVTEDAGQSYLIMEYLPSKSLSVVLAERGSMPPAEVAEIGAQAAAALASAHAVGVVHRDVKPGNVLLGHDGTVKITDFGISRAVEDVTGTLTGVIAGTPAYLSPEVAKGERATFSSDVFSLGATLYTAVEGTPPFGMTDNAMAMLYRIASKDPAPPTRAGPMTEVLMQLLRKDPDQRPTMAQVRDALRAVAMRPSDGAPATGSVAPTAQLTQQNPDGAGGPPLTVDTASPPAAAPERPSAWPKPRPSPAPKPARKPARTTTFPRRRAVLVGAALVVIATVGVLVITLINGGVPGLGTAAPPAISGAAPTGTTAGSAQPAATSAATPSGSTAAEPSPTGVPAPPQNVASTPQAAITEYYALVPGNLQEAWTRLTPKYQQSPSGGYAGYQNWWNQIRSVQVSDVVATGANTVEATVEYAFKDGRVVRERHSYTFVDQNGRWLIDESTVLSSQTL